MKLNATLPGCVLSLFVVRVCLLSDQHTYQVFPERHSASPENHDWHPGTAGALAWRAGTDPAQRQTTHKSCRTYGGVHLQTCSLLQMEWL